MLRNGCEAEQLSEEGSCFEQTYNSGRTFPCYVSDTTDRDDRKTTAPKRKMRFGAVFIVLTQN